LNLELIEWTDPPDQFWDEVNPCKLSGPYFQLDFQEISLWFHAQTAPAQHHVPYASRIEKFRQFLLRSRRYHNVMQLQPTTENTQSSASFSPLLPVPPPSALVPSQLLRVRDQVVLVEEFPLISSDSVLSELSDIVTQVSLHMTFSGVFDIFL
jgi:hypothetical protein